MQFKVTILNTLEKVDKYYVLAVLMWNISRLELIQATEISKDLRINFLKCPVYSFIIINWLSITFFKIN